MVSILSDVDLKQWHQFCVELGELYGFKNETTASLIKTYPRLVLSLLLLLFWCFDCCIVSHPWCLSAWESRSMPEDTSTNRNFCTRSSSPHLWVFSFKRFILDMGVESTQTRVEPLSTRIVRVPNSSQVDLGRLHFWPSSTRRDKVLSKLGST